MKRLFLILPLIFVFVSGSLKAADNNKVVVGVVNFTTCVMESKYGKHEQAQLEKIRMQWSSLIEETEKELKTLSSQFEDQDYLDSLSPEAEDELKIKYKTLNEDLAKYQNQLYQNLNQANYFFIQKLATNISKASEQIAAQKKLDLIVNKEACFFHSQNMEVTPLVIAEMDKSFDQEIAMNDAAEKAKNEKQPENKKAAQ